MHIVTFYSYKGGVGRTMAVVNSAVLLAQSGRKVLVVDFDLEAPGISTYSAFSCLTNAKGVVEYVSEYIDTATAPNVEQFIVPSKVGGADIWTMPAGARDRAYASRLNAIDWQSLYTLKAGYLFFEDLKLQWKSLGFDYVLIDSRTGHTDVGGICTRQMPDAVVLMFFPNDQNLIGLESVVKDIREEPKGPRRKDIILHFCASNVPDLDDEEHILERKLLEARKRLGCRASPALIHHYNSLTLIEQSIFVLDRPASKLAAEYKSLLNLIVSQNLEDAKGAIAELRRIRNELRKIREEGGEEPRFQEQLKEIRDLHPNDGDVAWLMAEIYSGLGELAEETRSLTIAIDAGINVGSARRRRASIARLRSQPEEALVDLQEIFLDEKTSSLEFIAALELIRDFDSNWISIAARSPSLIKMDLYQALRVAEILMSDARGNEIVISMLKRLLAQTDGNNRGGQVRLALALISSKQFGAAMETLAPRREDVTASRDPVIVFNYAMAEWGKTGNQPLDLMALVTQLIGNPPPGHPNVQQCLALAYFVCGNNTAAKSHLELARVDARRMAGREFSCWRYLEASRSEMQNDLDQLDSYIGGSGIGPTVFALASAEKEGTLLLS